MSVRELKDLTAAHGLHMKVKDFWNERSKFPHWDKTSFAVSRAQGQTPASKHLVQVPEYLISFLLGLSQARHYSATHSNIATKARSPQRERASLWERKEAAEPLQPLDVSHAASEEHSSADLQLEAQAMGWAAKSLLSTSALNSQHTSSSFPYRLTESGFPVGK